MDQRTLYAKTLRYQKAGVDVFFNLVATVQQGGQSIMVQSLENVPWLPQSSKKSCISLFDQCFKNTQALKDAVYQGYSGLDLFFQPARPAPVEKTVSAPVKKTVKESDVDEDAEKAAQPARASVKAKPKSAGTRSAVATKRTPRAKAGTPKKTVSRATTIAKNTVAADAEKKEVSVKALQPEVPAIKNKSAAVVDDGVVNPTEEAKSERNPVTENKQTTAPTKRVETGQK